MDRENRDRLRLVQYLDDAYPELIYWFDLAGESEFTTQKAATLKKKGFKVHDLIIDFPSRPYNGLRLELKRSDFRLFTQTGKLYTNEHISEQYKSVLYTREMGYQADFASGFEDAKNKIDWYLIGEHKKFEEILIAPLQL